MADPARLKQPVSQHTWQLPLRRSGTEEPTLKVYNSLTRTKVEFVTEKPGVVAWYNCGPTVYDSSHMGHARNYMTQDIMRRILRDYFGYEVNFVMNITDVDDKIILRARQSHLLTSYLASSNLSTTALPDTKAAWTTHLYKSLCDALSSAPASPTFDDALVSWAEVADKTKDPVWLEAQKAKNEKFGMHLSSLQVGLEGIRAAEKALDAPALIESNKDAMGNWLDKKFGATVTDPAIFSDFAAFWERSFFTSMKALHVERPTTLTRVAEYIPEIVTFVDEIIARGFAYEAGGSVWFDTTRFDGAEGAPGAEEEGGWKHSYAKIQPWSKGNRELLQDGEGSLSNDAGQREASHFALWKSSKPGEPAWPSPWGPGRPGWHIECSVMASAVHGPSMDVHSGGVDLAFPHHDNEIAQSEAHHGCRQWVNYFLHTGHLHIEGLKMSKSLKNFITIEDALTRHTARQLRFSFLSTTWHAKLDFKESSMQDVASSEAILNNFFANTNALVSELEANPVPSDGRHHLEQGELDLLAKLEEAQLAFRLALCDSFDTNKALQILLSLVSTSNTYVARGRKSINVRALVAVAEWVTRMLRMFGLGEGSPTDGNGERVIGWGAAPVQGQEGSADRESILMPYLRVMSTFRDRMRALAMAGAPASELLALSDQLRNVDLVDLGVALDDQDDGRALVKLINPEILRAARDAKLAAAQEKLDRKAAMTAAKEAQRLEKIEKGRLAPSEMFKTAEYSAWDDKGIPTLDKEGVAVAKSKSKKLAKEYDVQTKLHEGFLAEMAKTE